MKVTSTRYFAYITGSYISLLLLSTVLAYKLLCWHHHLISTASLIFPLTLAMNGLIAEVYGEHQAKCLLHTGIVCCLVFSFLLTNLSALPSPNIGSAQAYQVVFHHDFQFSAAGAVGSLLGGRINLLIVRKYPHIIGLTSLPLRILCANTVGEFILVCITTPLAFYAVVDRQQIIMMICFAYFSKVVISLILAWPTALLAHFLTLREST